jgi:DNA-3-methyladenine glycosylase II
MRPPRFPTLFETLLNGFACQQVSLAACIHLMNQLAEVRGRDVSLLDPAMRILPAPEDLARLDPEALREIGFSRQKSRYVIGLARQLKEDRLDLSRLASMTDDEARSILQQIPGVGRWTADYVLLRGLGRWHIFPPGDAGARGKLRHWLESEGSSDDEAVQRLIDSWQPFGGVIYFHLLLWDLERRGYLRGDAPQTVLT